MGTPLKVLIIQPPQTDAGSVQRQLWRGGFEPDCVLAESLPALQAVLANISWDIIFCHQGLSFLPQALTMLKTAGLDPPFIVIADSVIPMEQVTALMQAEV